MSNIYKLSDRYIYRASRKLRGAGGKYKYEMSVTVLNATREDEGMYTCRMERQEDRAYVSSWVTQGSRQTAPTVELISCANKPDKKQRGSRGQFPNRCVRKCTIMDFEPRQDIPLVSSWSFAAYVVIIVNYSGFGSAAPDQA